MKRVLGLSKHRQIRVSAQYSLEASGTVPTSGSGAALDNFAGASRAAAELSKALDGVFDWDDFADDPLRGRNTLLECLDEKAARFTNSSLDFCASTEQWDCGHDEAELIAAAWDYASGAYGQKGTSSMNGVSLTPVFSIDPTSMGTTKATTGSTFESCYSGHSYLIIAVRGTASGADNLLNLHGEPKDASALLGPEHKDVRLSAHSGFLSVALDLMPRLRPLIQDCLQQHRDMRVLFTGHSAGAAVASLLHLASKTTLTPQHSQTTFSCITFGSPPVAHCAQPQDRSALNQYLAGERVLHFVNEFDIVSRVDRSYIRSMLDLYAKESEEEKDQNYWQLPEPELIHLGQIVVLKIRAPCFEPRPEGDLRTDAAFSAWKLEPEDLAHLLFCRRSVHHRTVYRDRVSHLQRGQFNGRDGWSSTPLDTSCHAANCKLW